MFPAIVALARFTSVLAAVLWLAGLPYVSLAGAIPSDAEYFAWGGLGVLVGAATLPLASIYPGSFTGRWVRPVRAAGVMICVGLVVTGVLLVSGATGGLGSRAPGWVSPAGDIAVIAFFAWVVVAGNSARRSPTLGRAPFWLGLLGGGAFLLQILVAAVEVNIFPNATSTDWTALLLLVPFALYWLCIPAWFVVLASRMRGREAVAVLLDTGPSSPNTS